MKLIIKKILNRALHAPGLVCPNPDGTEYEVNNIVLSDFVLAKLVPVVGTNPYPLNELLLMAGAVCRFRPTHVFEWGTNIGASARVFYETARQFKIPLDIHSIDLPDNVGHVEHPGSSRGRLVRNKPGVTLHLGDGLETSLSIYRTLPTGSRALFFVDGDHGYKSVRHELDSIVKHVEAPIVLLHDTFYQSTESGYNTGPYLAVKEVLESMPPSRKLKTIVANTGLPGMTLVY